jgi:gliding motility-associated-like protein
MKRFVIAILTILVLSGTVEAAHIIGGEMRYEYVGPGSNPNTYRYRIVMILFKGDDPNGAPLSTSYVVAIYNNDNGNKVVGTAANNNWLITRNDPPGPLPVPIILPTCIINAPVLNYTYATYTMIVELPQTVSGYTVVYQTCCRINGMANVGNSTGSTYNCIIPGSSTVPDGQDSAPQFGLPVNVICKNAPFTLNFTALDPNPGDSLRYSLCNAYNGGAAVDAGFNDPAPPPYGSVNYISPYTGLQPLGSLATINPATGVITGTAPGLGNYVVCVCVNVFRNGVLIATHRKDLIVRVSDCTVTVANPIPSFVTCDGFNIQFSHNSIGANTVFWEFGDPTTLADTAITDSPTWDYNIAGAGTYTVKFVINRGTSCADSVERTVGVFPGFFPDFTFTGSCFQNAFQFRDATTTNYGVVDSWRWDFGDGTTLADTSHLQNPQYTYPSPGTRDVQLTVTNSKGCITSKTISVDVLDKPALTLGFRDTLICQNDPLQLNSSGTGTFSWSAMPATAINPANSPTPTVSPLVTTWFFVTLNDNGCVTRDSTRVRVVSAVTLNAGPDTTICLGDPVQLNAISDGLRYSWSATPSATFDDPNIINPVATSSSSNTRYTVVASIGSCSATDFIDVIGIPYPGADAGLGPVLCYNTSGQLNANMVGSSFTWTPASYLDNPNSLTPVVTPPRTTQYILSVFDTLGCPKPGRDTVIVRVQPKIQADAGDDTTVVVGQPLLFNGSGGVGYTWLPPFALSNPNIRNPIGVYGAETDSVEYKLIVTDSVGCADSAFVTVYVYKTNPYVFVPSAFTPNNDGLNDVIRPIAVGIRKINYFAVYNRWGERVFWTSTNKHGWNGIYNGKPQGTGVFVWMLSAEDYIGRPLFLKGHVTLIR